MNKLSMLAFANIRKNKSQAISLIVLVMMAALLLNLGLLLILNFGKSFDQRNDALNGSHYTIVASKSGYSDSQFQYLQNYTGVTQVEKEEVLSSKAEFIYSGTKQAGIAMFVNAGKERLMNPLTTIGDVRSLNDTTIYVPYILKTGGGYKIGDDFSVSIQGKDVNFKIAGSTEETFFGASTTKWFRFFLSDDGYTKLAQTLPTDVSSDLQSVRLDDINKGSQIQLDFAKEFLHKQDESLFVHSTFFNSVKNARIFLSNITAMIFVSFSIVIVLVSLIVVRFRISNSIEEGMTNIGALKALGYTSKQIILSIVLQFVGLAIVGIALGVFISYLTLPGISKMLEAQTALIWKQGFDLQISMTAVLLLLFVVSIVTLVSARRIMKIYPLSALRGGIVTHNFRKNYFPLENAHGALSYLLALKTLLLNKRQSLMIALIIAAVSFAGTASLAIYYNMALKPDQFKGLVAGELPDAIFTMKQSQDTTAMFERIKQRSEVRKIFYYDKLTLLVDGKDIQSYVTADYSKLEGNMLYEGRYPRHENEVAISGTSAEQIGKNIGDQVEVSQGDKKGSFLITGFVQTTNNDGNALCITNEGIKQLQKEYAHKQIYAYLKNGENIKDFIKSVKASEDDAFANTLNFREMVNSQFEVYSLIFTWITVVILGITIMVVVLVLYMVIKAMILHRTREMGIQKALGFTTFQLMQQISLSFLPVLLVGVVVGGVSGYFGFSSLFTALIRNMGIMKASLPSPTGLTVLLCVGLVIFAYIISMIISWRVRKISP